MHNHTERHASQHDSHGRAPVSKKGAAKKATDPSETSKLLAAKISQLESDRAGERDQEAEIEREVKRANRDLSNLLSNIESPLSRLDVVQKKYTDLLADMRRLEREYGKSKKRAEQLQKDRDVSKTELSKMVSMKEKMEKLSRELQKEKQKLKEENKRLEETECMKIDRLNRRMDDMLSDVQAVVSQKEDPGYQKLDSKTEELFKNRFKTLIEQYELREQIFAHTLRKKEIEVQASMARFENEKKAAEQEVARSRDLRVQVATFSQTETELRSQLNVYVEKFKQVEDTLNNSNDLFLTFRKEMEDMSRKTKRLERENLNLIRKHDLTNRNILGMAEERTRMNKEMELLKKKNANLEKLCRGMQAQGRGTSGASSTSPHAKAGDGMTETDRTESEYEYEDDDEDNDDDDEDVEDGDEDEDEDEDDEDGLFVAERSYGDPDATSVSDGPLRQGHATAIRAGGVKQRRGPTYGSVPDSVSSMAPSSAAPAPSTPDLATIMPVPTSIASRAPHLPPPPPPPPASSPEAQRPALRQQQQQPSSQPQRPQTVGGGTKDGSSASGSKPGGINIHGRGGSMTGGGAGGANHATGTNSNSNSNSGNGSSSTTLTRTVGVLGAGTSGRTAGVASGVEGSRHGGSTKH